MKKLPFKKILLFIGAVSTISIILIFMLVKLVSATINQTAKTDTVSVKSVSSEILADGMIRSQNEVTLHFLTGGKVVYLPFKEGDTVTTGETIASLDSYTIQKQLEAALNNYKIARDNFGQIQNNQQNNYLYAQQANPYPFNYFNLGGIGGNDKDKAVNDMIKNLLEQSQANLDNSVIQVQLANYAFTLANLSSPINGVLIHEDITNPGIIVSPQNSFVVIDPNSLIFKANVSEDDINYVSVGAVATVKLNGIKNRSISGNVIKIYPDRITLQTGENVYQVDIVSDEIGRIGKYEQSGVVLIKNNLNYPVVLVPSWLVLSQQFIWVMQNGKPVLKSVKIGNIIGNNTEIIQGLNKGDQIILNSASIISKRYSIL